MDIGIPKQRRPFDYRVGLTPMGVEILTGLGHRVYVERDAGQGSGFEDERYTRAGAQIVYSPEEVYGRSQMILSVSRPMLPEFDLLQEGQILLGFFHFAVAHPGKIELMLKRNVTAIAYETIQTEDGHLPVLTAVSQIAGRMIATAAAQFLQNDQGGHGVLLGGVPGVPPAKVIVLGAGIVGTNAARVFLDLGADVTILDTDVRKLQNLEERGFKAKTIVAYDFNIAKAIKYADVLVGAVLIPGARAPHVVTREMVRMMKPRSLIMDISIDQGGCVETSRPTSYQNPTYIEENVIHYCVPNMTGVVARTTTHAFNNAAWPYIQQIAQTRPGRRARGRAGPAPRPEHPQRRDRASGPARIAGPAIGGDCRRRIRRRLMASPQYHSKLCSADVAVQAIKSHNRVFMTGNCSVPKELLGALVRRAPELEDVEIVQVLTIGPADYVAPEMQGHIRVNSLFISHNVRKAVNEGRADFTPIFLSQIPQALRDPKLLRPDVAMIHCSPPDEHGFCTFGVEVGLTKPAAESARIVIAEVNDRMPRTLGDSFIHVSRLTHIVPVSYPIVEVPQGRAGRAPEADRRAHRRVDSRRRHHADGHRRNPGRGAALSQGQAGPGGAHRALLRWRDGVDRGGGAEQRGEDAPPRQVRGRLCIRVTAAV